MAQFLGRVTIGIAGTGLAYVLVAHTLYQTSAGDLANLKQREIENIVVHSPHGHRSLVKRSDWPILQKQLLIADRLWFSGFKGESWKEFCSLAIETGSFPEFGFSLATRSSMKGVVQLQVFRGSSSSKWIYGDYDGSKILSYLQSKYPDSCGADATQVN